MATASPNFARRRRAAACDPPRAGFTLVEVLATLMLLAIVLPVVMKGITLASAVGSAARRRTDAGALAESKLNELLATGYWQNSVLSGDCGPDWPDYTWDAQLIPWGQGQGVSASNITQELDVNVHWNARDGRQTLTLSTLVYQSANTTTSGAGGSSSSGAASSASGASTGGSR